MAVYFFGGMKLGAGRVPVSGVVSGGSETTPGFRGGFRGAET